MDLVDIIAQMDNGTQIAEGCEGTYLILGFEMIRLR